MPSSDSDKRYSRKYKRSIRGQANQLYHIAKRRAKTRGLPFRLDREWIVERLKYGKCQVTGLEFTLKGQAFAPFAPSLDRIRVDKGYTPGNLQLVCWIYNAAKGVNEHNDVMAMAYALVKGGDRCGLR